MAEEKKNVSGSTEEEEAPNLMTLADEDGNEVTFDVLDELDYEGQHYLGVVEYTDPEEQKSSEESQLILLHAGKDDDGEYLDIVDDDEQLLKIGKLFEKRLADKYDIY